MKSETGVKMPFDFGNTDDERVRRGRKDMFDECRKLEQQFGIQQGDVMYFHRYGITPQSVIDEQMAWAGMIAGASNHDRELIDGRVEWVNVQRKNWKAISAVSATTLAHSVPFYWTTEMRLAATTPSPLPRHHITDLHLPQLSMWWTWEDSVVLRQEGVEHLEGVGLLVAMMRDVDDDLYLFTLDVQNARDETTLPLRRLVPWYTPVADIIYPDDFADGHERRAYERLARMVGFLNSPFISFNAAQPTRSERRRSKRFGIELPKEVNFVTLRRSQQSQGNTNGMSGRTYDYQWIVSGHFRNQFYPTTQTHKLIWIAPYMKGPEDKPLKPRAYKVVR